MATSEFGKAFRAARSAGKDTFTFNGKKYITELAKPAASKPSSSAPSKAPSNTMFDSGSSKTPYQMAQDMKAKEAAMPKPKGMTFQESMAKTEADEQARNAARSARNAANAKRRGDAIKDYLDKAGKRLTTKGYNARPYTSDDAITERKGGSVKAKKMAKGGSFRTSANGIARKGKTRGKFV